MAGISRSTGRLLAAGIHSAGPDRSNDLAQIQEESTCVFFRRPAVWAPAAAGPEPLAQTRCCSHRNQHPVRLDLESLERCELVRTQTSEENQRFSIHALAGQGGTANHSDRCHCLFHRSAQQCFIHRTYSGRHHS